MYSVPWLPARVKVLSPKLPVGARLNELKICPRIKPIVVPFLKTNYELEIGIRTIFIDLPFL